jgi:NADH dehydrogenase
VKVLVAGGTGTLGRLVVQRLVHRGFTVRILSRQEATVAVEHVAGDVRDLVAVETAMQDVDIVVSAMHGFAPDGGGSPDSVDRIGNANLVDAAERAGVQHFALMSVHGACPEHPMELFRAKHAAELNLRRSQLGWTVVRATAFMETWADIVGAPFVRGGRARVFGRGDNPINFVSAHDVADVVARAVVEPRMRNATVDVVGPENLTMNDVVRCFASATGRPAQAAHVPLPVMRLASRVLGHLNPSIARMIRAGVVMDTENMAVAELPTTPMTSFADVVRRDWLESSTVSTVNTASAYRRT